ncbi:hypothetical protein LEFCBN_LEFCBN_12945, partial [Dysosmobacter welbionis]
PLHPDKPRPAVLPAKKTEQAVEGGQGRVYCGRRPVLGQQPLLPASHSLFGHGGSIQPADKSLHIPQILLPGASGPLFYAQISVISGDLFCTQNS